MKRLILIAVVLSVGMSLAGWRGRFDEQFAAATSTARLPAEYQEVEYLESTSTQWIDTGLTIIGRIWEIKTAFDPSSLPYQGAIVYSGSYHRCHTDGDLSSFGGRLGSTRYTPEGNFAETNIVSFSAMDGIRVNGGNWQAYSGTLPNLSIYLFRRHGSGISGSPASAKIFYSKMWTTAGVLVQDFVPAVRKSDSVAGMYDLVTDTFKTNDGTGVFVAGPDVH